MFNLVFSELPQGRQRVNVLLSLVLVLDYDLDNLKEGTTDDFGLHFLSTLFWRF